jgi:hypothetical protein
MLVNILIKIISFQANSFMSNLITSWTPYISLPGRLKGLTFEEGDPTGLM